MSDYKGEGNGEEVFPHEVHKLIIAEARVGGPDSEEHN